MEEEVVATEGIETALEEMETSQEVLMIHDDSTQELPEDDDAVNSGTELEQEQKKEAQKEISEFEEMESDGGDDSAGQPAEATESTGSAENAVEQSESVGPQHTEQEQQVVEKQDENDERLDKNKSDLVDNDTEMVSEDELEVEAKEALETEEVSDEELPASITEGLQTEAVSDEELPPLGKRKRKERVEARDRDKEVPRKKGKKEKKESPAREEIESEEKPTNKPLHPAVKSKVLPELEKYWKSVNEDQTDFTGWTYLLQYVDQESDVEAAREAYNSFLALYPYCYGYWRKYADYEKKKGEKEKCEEVFLRGLKAIPLSVDLWLHYLNFCKVQHKEDEGRVRAEFARGIEVCGLEFRSDRLWDSFIKWELEGKHYQNAFKLYEKLLQTPTQGYKTHFEDFEDFVHSQQPNKILDTDEFLSLRSEVLQKLKSKPGKDISGPPGAAPPGADDDEEKDLTSPAHADEETKLIRERVVSSRKKFYKDTVTAVQDRWNFEEGIKRPYFHVKPLERSQLNTWREYLDYEIAQGDEVRTIILFERCLIACALYQEFWLKFIKYLEELPKDTSEKMREVYERACLIHHPKKAFLALSWATFEESLGNIEEARKILQRLEENVPNILHVAVRRINLERRAGNLDGATELYETYTANTKNKANFIALSIKYARYSWKILNDVKKGIEVLRKALEKDSDNPRLYSQLVELTLVGQPLCEDDCLQIFDEAINNEKMDIEFRRIFAQRKVEFLEDFGSSIKRLRDTTAKYKEIMNEVREKSKSAKNDVDKAKQEELLKSTKKSDSTSSAAYANNYQQAANYNANYADTNYNQSYQQQGFYSGDQGYQPYQNWGGYSQTSANYTNYSQNWPGYNYSY